MIGYLKKTLFGSHSDKELKKYLSLVNKINEIEPQFENLTEADCKAKTEEYKERYQKGESLDSLLPEAFALVRRAAQNSLEQRHFDVQLLGGIALHKGQIAEMKTGEGKTLTSTLPLYLNALTGKGVHLITVNDYLAERDANWMGEVYTYLGMTVGVITNSVDDFDRRAAYRCDITYGTNNEFGFDYLRDNMKFDLEDYAQREHHFAIVDEVDSILIDEARTPLIISGPAEDSTENYLIINKELYGLVRGYRVSDDPSIELIAKEHDMNVEEAKAWLATQEDLNLIIAGDFTLEEKSRNIQLTDQGVEKMQLRVKSLMQSDNLYDFENIEILHHVNSALKAHYIFKRDIDYVVQGGKVIIVDEFTGRLMDGRRFSEGLHQALEAKENVKIEKENQTLASITFQNYFRKYDKLAGMTGTAETEAEEFRKIYGLGVVVMPTNVSLARKDQADVIYKTKAAKDRAIVSKVKELHEKKQPVLVGTASIESSEHLSKMIKKAGVPHTVLNAKHHDKEAEIITGAGRAGAVTIATNMAGRGTDIKLGTEELESGGLYILGTERNESRRVDNQLRGRAGRQGDAGESRFFLSLEDDLLRIFGGERIANLMGKLNIDEDEAIEHVLISKAIENSQKKVEAYHFDIRKHLLEYDDVMNRQREVIYKQRRDILGGDGEEVFITMMEDKVDALIAKFCDDKHLDEWDIDGLHNELFSIFDEKIGWDTSSLSEAPSDTDLFSWLMKEVKASYDKKAEHFGEVKDILLKRVLLEITDNLWKDHLLSMDHLKEGIGMRGYAQKNPLTEYKREGFELFQDLMDRIHLDCIKAFFHVQIVAEPSADFQHSDQPMEMIHESAPNPSQQVMKELNEPPPEPKQMPVHKQNLPGRNDLCHCGSGKKYKSCHMREDQQPA